MNNAQTRIAYDRQNDRPYPFRSGVLGGFCVGKLKNI